MYKKWLSTNADALTDRSQVNANLRDRAGCIVYFFVYMPLDRSVFNFASASALENSTDAMNSDIGGVVFARRFT